MEAHPVPSTSARADYSQYLLEPTNVTPSSLSGTMDLITLFNLDPLYNTFLRPYLPVSASKAAGGAPESPVPTAAATTTTTTKGAISIKGKERETMTPVASPAPGPCAVASPAPGSGSGGGFKITLGGIKLTSSLGASAGAGAVTNAPPAGNTKSKRVKMEKNYSHMIQDVLGRNSIKKDQYLSHLVMNPDPVPCPPLQVPDPQLLRDALTLKVGGLAGFDMSTWENGPPEGTEKKKKKRKQQQQYPEGTEVDRKKQRER
ncbi:hypothetical protein JCM3766R1_005254 [Sporobolomyces carnicolor]